MNIILLAGLAIAVLLLRRRPAPRTRVIYVPLHVEQPRGGGLGCLPLLLLAALLLIVLQMQLPT